jgi:DNA-binding response OmpR family regulator
VRVVLIDDEQRLLDALETAFCFRWPEAEVLTATEAGIGLALIVERRPDAVVLDVRLPDRNGFDVLADIRRTSDVPVIMLTAARDEMDHVRGLDLGADDYLTKPVGAMALLAHIQAVIRRAQPLADPSRFTDVTLGRFRLDGQGRQAVGSAGRVRLTPTEFRLLYYLMRNAGHVVCRSTLIRRVWGDADGATEHDLRVFIGRVRGKIAHVGDPPTILTEHGIGYRIAPS